MTKRVLTWPQAENKANEYARLVGEMLVLKNNIDKVASYSLLSAGKFCDSTLTGDYYDSYSQHVDEWCAEGAQIITECGDFVSQLNNRISKLDACHKMWRSRIGVTHTVEIPEEEEE